MPAPEPGGTITMPCLTGEPCLTAAKTLGSKDEEGEAGPSSEEEDAMQVDERHDDQERPSSWL